MEKAVYSAVLTPFKKDLSIDTKLFISHCEFLLKNKFERIETGVENRKISYIKVK